MLTDLPLVKQLNRKDGFKRQEDRKNNEEIVFFELQIFVPRFDCRIHERISDAHLDARQEQEHHAHIVDAVFPDENQHQKDDGRTRVEKSVDRRQRTKKDIPNPEEIKNGFVDEPGGHRHDERNQKRCILLNPHRPIC